MDTLDLKLLRLHEDQFILNNGLKRTVDIKTTVKLAHIFAKQNVILMHIKYDQWTATAKKNTTLIIKLDSIDVKRYLAFAKLMHSLGWFTSEKSSFDNEIFSEKAARNHVRAHGQIRLSFEVKFDLVVPSDDNRIENNSLYYVTVASNLEKIKKIGLVPKSNSKIATPPERVYLSLKKADAISLAKMVINIKPTENLILITINTQYLPDYVKLYSEPKYFNIGVYTLNNITPVAIVDYREF